MLAEKIRDGVNPQIQIIEEVHPLKIKGIIGTSSGTVGSGFHGLLSALSQGIPALATGWSLKYQMLFKDYGFPKGLLNVHMTPSELQKTMDLIIVEKSNQEIVNKIQSNSTNLKNETNKMWHEVFSLLKK